MDFNMFPSSGPFASDTGGNFPATSTGGGWFYDHGIASGDFSLRVKNAGFWKPNTAFTLNRDYTILTVEDPTGELLQCSTSFTATHLSFDEDEAEKRLGSLVQTWNNSRSLVWDETCFHSWNTLDYAQRLSCNFRIANTPPSSGLQFNNDSPYYFRDIVGGMSSPQITSQAIYELQNLSKTGVTGGLTKFTYQVAEKDPNTISYMLGGLDTYTYPSIILGVTGSVFLPEVNHGVISSYVSPATIISATAAVTGGIDLTVTPQLPKKKSFIGDIEVGEFYVRNIKGLLETDVYVGEVISGAGLNFSPLAPSFVIDIIVSGGKIDQLKLSEAARESYIQSNFNIEWFTPANSKLSFQLLKNTGTYYIDAYANSPGSDSLGYISAKNGAEIYDWSGSVVKKSNIGHTYPLRNSLYRFGYGKNNVGAFETGPNEFYINERGLQVYFTEGINPNNGGERGWYPAEKLSLAYSYIGSAPFGNTGEAQDQSNRLPYETAIGGAWTWEDAYIGKNPASLPTGSTVLLTSEASEIAGKTKFLWILRDSEGKTLVEIVDPVFMWTFVYEGKFSVELQITDTNGNSKRYIKKDFFEIYETIKQHS
jgi:hypothetical protein